MGCDVYLFRVDQTQLIKNITNDYYKAVFTRYVEERNIKYKRTESWSKLDAAEILKKTETNFFQLTQDEFWEIIIWINYSNAENPDRGIQFKNSIVKAKLNEFGFYLVENFQDNTRVFLFALGDFLSGYHNDIKDENRTYACLTNGEFDVFLNYVSCLYATVLTETTTLEDIGIDKYLFVKMIDKCAENILLKNLIETESKLIIESKSIDTDGSAIFDIGSTRKIFFGDFSTAIYRCQDLKEQLKNNALPIVILDS
jgi:hypothetical protein